MSVVLSRPPSALYREEQNFEWWLYVCLLLVVVLATISLKLPSDWREPGAPVPFRWPTLQAPVSFVLGLGLPTFLVICVLHMTTEVGPEACCVSFGWIPTYHHVIMIAEIERVEIVTYHAVRQHWFWGIRTTRDGERVLTARGDRAVRLRLIDGTSILIGTQRPEDLAAVLKREQIL